MPYGMALSRILCGAPPSTETIQMLEVFDDKSSAFSLAGWAFTRNLVLSENQSVISHLRFSFLSPSGWGTDRVSSVPTSLTWIPLPSVYARYFPSGEMPPLDTGFSLGLKVSCRSFRSGTIDGGRFVYQKTAATRTKASTTTVAAHHRKVRAFGRMSRFRTSKSVRSCAAD